MMRNMLNKKFIIYSCIFSMLLFLSNSVVKASMAFWNWLDAKHKICIIGVIVLIAVINFMICNVCNRDFDKKSNMISIICGTSLGAVIYLFLSTAVKLLYLKISEMILWIIFSVIYIYVSSVAVTYIKRIGDKIKK